MTIRGTRLGVPIIVWLLAVVGLATSASRAEAQSASLRADAPAPPVAPEVVARDADGRATVRAVRVKEPLKIDGALDEALYRDERSIAGFTQVEPDGGQAASERTETGVAFEDKYVYVSFKIWDRSMDMLIATEMRREALAQTPLHAE